MWCLCGARAAQHSVSQQLLALMGSDQLVTEAGGALVTESNVVPVGRLEGDADYHHTCKGLIDCHVYTDANHCGGCLSA